MKKLIIMAVACVMGLSASAQILTSRTFTERKSTTIRYIRVGGSFNNVTGDISKDNDALGSKLGYDVAFGFQKNFGQSAAYWGMELGVGTRGYSAEEGDYEESVIFHSAKWSPFTFGYKYALNDDIKIDGHLGAFVSYDFAGKGKYKNEYDEEDIDFSDLKDYYKQIDAGLQVGVGVWYKRFNLDLTYQRGFIDANDDSDYSIFSSNFMVRLGVAF